jgi:hypothetical protein
MRNDVWTNYHTKSGLFLKATKKQVYLKEVVKSLSDSFNLHKFYHVDKLIGCMFTSCGYDRGPKREDYIYRLLDIVDGCYDNPSNNKRTLNMEHFNAYVEKAELKLSGLELKIKQIEL